MNHQRHAHRFKFGARQFGTNRGGGRWQFRAEHMREIHASARDYPSTFDQTRDATAAFRTLPLIANEGASIDSLQRVNDVVL